ncbi:hypothetical protein ZIOFF_036793 [Zingiber officinale]|uniref:ribose-5-phosphate isomerase n=1 Tax=Zingiber officinale TaxID=94328 RepID=A0A8J5L8E0_ZINOF|nr:hypothetical protein ZIOFF_036793 [Zingiber officinale]
MGSPFLLQPSRSLTEEAMAAAGQSQDDLKRIAALRAVELVRSGMVLGLGTGSTAAHALDRIGDLLRGGDLGDIVGIPTSEWAAARAAAAGIPLTDLAAHPVVDLSIDGADEVDPALNLVKGRGGSLLREKMVEGASRRFVVIVDDSKLVPRLGGSGLPRHPRGESEIEPFVTDNKNYIVDLFFEDGIHGDLQAISDDLLRITDVVEHGMFLGLATSVIIARKDGVVLMDKEAKSNGF